MATTIPSAEFVPIPPVFTSTERLALAGFLAGYSGLTRQAYELDLRQYVSWCHLHQLQLFAARRADIECSARDLEASRRPRASRASATRAGVLNACHPRRSRCGIPGWRVGLTRRSLPGL